MCDPVSGFSFVPITNLNIHFVLNLICSRGDKERWYKHVLNQHFVTTGSKPRLMQYPCHHRRPYVMIGLMGYSARLSQVVVYVVSNTIGYQCLYKLKQCHSDHIS